MTVRVARGPIILLYLSAAALTAEIVHLIVYVFDHGLTPSLTAAMAFGGHHSYFLATLLITAIALVAAIFLSPSDLQAIRNRVSPRRLATAWVAMMVVGSIGFVVFENLETLHGDSSPAGLSPTRWLIDPGVVAAMAIVCMAIASVLAVLTAPRLDARDAVLRSPDAGLVAAGVTDPGPQTADWATTFLVSTIREPLASLRTRRPLRILEAGTGTGVGFWLETLPSHVRHLDGVELRGVDSSIEMVGEARQRLATAGIVAELAVGDILDAQTFRFSAVVRHDLVFAYDMVQRLPPHLQDAAVAQLYRHVSPGGWLVIFDSPARPKSWWRPSKTSHSPSFAHLRRLMESWGAEEIRCDVEAHGRRRAISAKRRTERG